MIEQSIAVRGTFRTAATSRFPKHAVAATRPFVLNE
jgi:hypothetical protein